MLLNPPGRSTGARTRNAVSRAARVLGYDHVTITNLCAVPTRSVVELNNLGHDAWELARGDLEAGLSSTDAILAGWGIAGVAGEARRSLCAQVAWLQEVALAKGIESFWMIGGEPRHPSRWHQYVADKYQRTSGGSFEERIRQVLVAVPIRESLGAPPVGLGPAVGLQRSMSTAPN